MINTLIENMGLKKVPLTGLAEKLMISSNIGCLVVDANHQVVAVNPAFQKFYSLYNDSIIHTGDYLRERHLHSLPEIFVSGMNKILAGTMREHCFQIDYLGDETFSFDVTAEQLSEEKDNMKGVCILVHRREMKPFIPKIAQDEDFFKLLVDNSTSVYQLADASFAFTWSSAGVENILGYLPAELLTKNVIELVHPDDREQVRDWLIDVRRFPEKLLTTEYRVKKKQGEYIWIENNARNMLANGRICAIVMHFRNVQVKKIADHALIQAEQRLSLLLNNTEESFIILNSRLRIVTYNKAAQERSPFFYNAELQSELSVLDLIDAAEVEDYINLFEEVFTGKEIEKESRFVDTNDTVHIYSHTFRPLLNLENDIFGVFITSTDVTERKKLTEEVALNSERLKTAQKIAGLGYFEYDLLSKKFYCSEQFYGILGIEGTVNTLNELLTAVEIMMLDEFSTLKNEARNSVLTGKEFSLEFRLTFRNEGEKIILAMGGSEMNDAGKTVTFRLTLQDITDSKMATLAIQTLETKFKSLFDNSIDGVVLSDLNGAIISANPSVCKLLGYNLAELTSLNRKDIIDENSSLVAVMIEMQQKNRSFVGELFLQHKKGYSIPVEITSVCMEDGNRNPYISTIIRDITEKKKIETEQNLLTEELLKNNRDLQQFSFITSHNLRAPVANLLSLLTLYNKDNPGDDFNQLLIEKFEEATMQLNQTLNDLVNVLVIKSNNNIEKEAISLTGIFIQVKKNIESLLTDKKGTIEANFSAIDELQYNRIHIESIFLNMISNAIRYSSPDRRLKIKIKSYKQENWVVVEFGDNGLGMDLNRYGDRLFGLYQRFHGNVEGKGLGLYMTRSQVIAMGGKIEVESEPGKGTTFKIYFKS